MDELYYDMIFKRKSCHIFSGVSRLSDEEIKEILCHIQKLQPLVNGINTEFRIVPRAQTSCKRGEYCILIYSEMKEHYLHNVGYMAEQLDLWLAAKNIGACWYGMGKTSEMKYNGLDFVIMIAIEKVEEEDFRKDFRKAKRKSVDEIWTGNEHTDIASVVRYSPSACNTQPWLVKFEGSNMYIYQVKGKRGMITKDKVDYYNKIDMGIFMLFFELCLEHEKLPFCRDLYTEALDERSKIFTAAYKVPLNII